MSTLERRPTEESERVSTMFLLLCIIDECQFERRRCGIHGRPTAGGRSVRTEQL
jgi:hypothetical protein